MTHWNHRVVKQILNKGRLNEEEWFSVREVFYTDDGTIFAYSENPSDICGESIEEMREYLNWCLLSLDKDVLIDGEVKFVDEGDEIPVVNASIPSDVFTNWLTEQTPELTKSEVEKQKRIKVNKAQCLSCFGIIESKYRHDFVTCSCGKFSVDGGKDYLKRSGDFNSFAELSEYYEEE